MRQAHKRRVLRIPAMHVAEYGVRIPRRYRIWPRGSYCDWLFYAVGRA